MKLATLKARSVRGIPRNWPDLSIGSKGLVIFGQNGVGKSSIVDSIEYGLSGNTSLYPVRRQNVTWENGAPHVRDGEEEISVDVVGTAMPFTLSSEGIPEGITEEDAAWIKAARSASFVLRRHMLLNFIIEQPRDRYSLLEPFMNLDTFRETEGALRGLKDELETAHVEVAATVHERQRPLRTLFNLEPAKELTEANLLEELNVVMEQLKIGAVSTRENLKERNAQIREMLGGEEQTARLAALGGLKTEVEHIGLSGDLSGLLESLIEATVELEKEIETRTDAVLTDLLVKGREAIESAGLATCPVCEQKIDREAVTARLTERIEADQRITAGRKLVGERRNALLNHLRPLAEAMERLTNRWSKSVQVPLPEAYPQTVALLRELETSVGKENQKSASLREALPRLNACVADHQPIIGVLDRLIAEEGGGERRGHLTRASALIEAFGKEWPAYEAAANEAKGAQRSLTIANRLHGHAVEARKAAVGALFDDVTATANRYYDKVHPGEGIATSKLQVRDAGQGSLTLSTTFHGREENPLLHYSESHLDTLSLCYFLALRRHEADMTPVFKVLVLDDVMHSVDAVHRGRIADLLKDEFSDHQIIITTHDNHFYDALRQRLGGNGYIYLRITNWDIERGPLLGDPLTDFDRIMVAEEREKLSQDTLASAGGRFFEWLLQEATEALAVPIQARFKRGHDIGNMWPPLASRLKKQKGFAAAHTAMVDRLEANGWVRNACGAHYNEEAVPATPEEVRTYAEGLASLHAALHCPDCGKIVVRQQNDDLRCQCGKLDYPAKVKAP